MELIRLVLPVFLIIFLGWLFGWRGIIPHDHSKPLIGYVFYVAAPAIIFLSIQEYSIEELFVWRFWVGYALAIIAVMVLSVLLFAVVFRYSLEDSFFAGLCCSVANVVMLGYPILHEIIGKKAVLPMAMCVLVFNIIVSPSIIFFLEWLKYKVVSWKAVGSALYQLVKNPFILAAFFGVLFSAFHLQLPHFGEKFLQYLALALIPVALFSVGLDLNAFHFKGNGLYIFLITVVNLVVRPLITIPIAMFMGLPPLLIVALVVFSSVPTAKSIYIFASKYEIKQVEAAAVIACTSIVAVITIPALLYLLRFFYPEIFSHIAV